MTRRFLTAVLVVALAHIAAMAADMTDVWNSISTNPKMITAQVEPAKATANGFDTLYVALNSAPTAADINDILRLADTVDASQHVTRINRQGIDVSIFGAMATADGKMYKIMIVVDKAQGEDKSLIVLYGLSPSDNVASALQNLSLEDIIGG